MSEKVNPTLFNNEAALAQYDHERLEKLTHAGKIVTDNLRILKKSGQNIVGNCLANQGKFFENNHYPKGDIYDSHSHAQYYYHAHRPESGEHGHFHTFLRAAGMPHNCHPAPYKGKAKRPTGKDAITHFVAVSMDGPGYPTGLFTTNRWVTDETFYRACDVMRILDRFDIELSYPCLATNRVLSSLLALFRPQIEALLFARDQKIDDWRRTHPGVDVYEDRNLEITSIIDINIERQIAAVNAAHKAISRAA